MEIVLGEPALPQGYIERLGHRNEYKYFVLSLHIISVLRYYHPVHLPHSPSFLFSLKSLSKIIKSFPAVLSFLGASVFRNDRKNASVSDCLSSSATSCEIRRPQCPSCPAKHAGICSSLADEPEALRGGGRRFPACCEPRREDNEEPCFFRMATNALRYWPPICS